MNHTRLFLVLGAMALVGCESESRLDVMRSVDTNRFIPLGEALQIAQKEVPDGFPIEAELEIEDDDEEEPAAYEVGLYVASREQMVEVEVDAVTGAVLEVEIEEDDGEDDDDGEDED